MQAGHRSEHRVQSIGRVCSGCVIGLLSLCLGLPAAQTAPNELNSHLRAAQVDLESANYSAAVTHLRAAVALQPALQGAYYQLGFALFQLHDLAGAEQAFKKELDFPPPDPYSLYYLGSIRNDANRRKEAVAFFTQSLAAGEVLDVRQKLASDYLAMGQVDEAIRFLELSVRARPEDGSLHYLLGRACKQQGRNAEAASEFDAAARWKRKVQQEMISISGLRQALKEKNAKEAGTRKDELFVSRDSDILLASANILGQAGLPQEAASFYKKALTISPKTAEAHYDLARADVALQNRSEAIAELQEAVQLKPRFYEAELLLGTLLADEDGSEAAIKHLRAAVDIKPDNPRLLMMLGLQYFRQNYFADATQVLKKAVELGPGDPDARYLLIESYYRNFEYEHALHLAEETAAKFPAEALSHYHLGAQLNNVSRFSEAKRELDIALAKDPSLVEAEVMLGELLFKMGKPDDSLRCFRMALAVDPKLMNAHAGLGKALIQLKHYPEAASAMEEAIQVDPKLAALHLYLSQAYRAIGRLDEAKAEAATFSRLNQERARARDQEGDRKYPN